MWPRLHQSQLEGGLQQELGVQSSQLNRSFGEDLDLEEEQKGESTKEDEETADGDFLLDSTKGMRNMMNEMKNENLTNQIQDLLEAADSIDSNNSSPTQKDFDPASLNDDILREESKEEEYDYFLDAHKEENRNENQGYHIIDQDDLENSKKNDEVDEDDLDQIQDKEVRDYRYQNMLEELREEFD